MDGREKAAKVNESRCVRSGKRRGGSERARGGNRKNGWAVTQAFCRPTAEHKGTSREVFCSPAQSQDVPGRLA